MAVTPERGFLLLADLTGYTAYLSSGEIEHAPTIAGDLLETIVGRLDPPFRLAKFEGDAAFLFVEDGRADGALLLDAVDAAYVAFRRRLRSIEQATGCDCNACAAAPRLDLKFFLHHGPYVRTQIAGRDELAGASVIVVHRLLKGPTAAAAHDDEGRASGFLVLTEAAVAAAGIDTASVGAPAGVETMEYLGSVTTHFLDLESRWRTEADRRLVAFEESTAVLDLQVSVAADPAAVWAHLTSPLLRPRWEGPIRIDEVVADGRRGVGTRAQCVTGRLATLEEILDWQPFEHVGYRVTVPEIGAIEAAYDLAFEAGHTNVRLRWSTPEPRAAGRTALGRLREDKRVALDRLVDILAASAEEERAR